MIVLGGINKGLQNHHPIPLNIEQNITYGAD